MFVLINFIFGLGIAVIDRVIGINLISGIYSLALFIPGLAVLIRRMHDLDKSGWWVLIIFIPLVGWIWLLVLLCKEGTSGVNQYGEDPKQALN